MSEQVPVVIPATPPVVVAPPVNTKFHDSLEEILALIKGHVPIIWVQTHEESRFIQAFVDHVATPTKRQVWLWSSYQGLLRYDQAVANSGIRASGEEAETWNPQKALNRITQLNRPNNDTKGICVIMRDFHTVLAEPVPRQIRDIYEHLMGTHKTLIVTSPVLGHGPGGNSAGLPPTLEKQISVVRFELPTSEQIHGRIEEVLNHMRASRANGAKNGPAATLDYNEEELQSFIRALQGLTMIEVDDAISTSITHLNKLVVQKLVACKKQIIRKSEILEFVEQNVCMDDIGGLDNAKLYLSRYATAYSDEAKEYGVEPLKGLLLTGVPGTGKSLLAKAVGSCWKIPLLRLDVGKVMTGLVGGSEGKMRDVINQAEAMSPCILWLDEVEKSLSGTKSSNFSDGGTLARVFGTLLTAMQDGLSGVSIIATANDITMLPPEFIRRFNEVFFVDLPGPDERWEIFKIHLEKRGRKLSNFEKQKEELLKVSDSYTGAEIEKAVKDAIAGAFYEKKKDLTHVDLIAALKDTKPIAKVMADKVAKLREKAKGQYRYASSYAQNQLSKCEVKTQSGKALDMNAALDDMNELTKTPKEKGKQATEGVNDRFKNVVND